MAGIDVLAAEHYGEASFFGAEVVRAPSNASINASVLYGLDNCRRVLEFYNGDILTPIDTFFLETSADNGVSCSQADCALCNMDERSERAKCTSVKLSRTNGSYAIARIREFHQFHIKAVFLENARIFCDEEFSLARRRKVADGYFVSGHGRGDAGKSKQECQSNSIV